jgi:hypothetical protein
VPTNGIYTHNDGVITIIKSDAIIELINALESKT